MFKYDPYKILILSAVDFILGALWHSPLLFAKPWMESVGLTHEKIEAMQKKNPNMTRLLGTEFVMHVITNLVHAYLFMYIDSASLQEALTLSFFVWVGFTAGPQLSPVLWENKSIKYFFINSGYRLTTMLIFSLSYYLIQY